MGMNMGMEIGIFLAYAAGIFLIYLFGKLLIVPVKWLGRLLVNSVLGGLFIFVLNLLGGLIGFGIPLNPLNALVVGVLGVPGAILLLLFCN